MTGKLDTNVVGLSEKELRKKKITEANEKNVLSVMNKTGWSHEYALEQIRDARKRLGITYKDYDVGNFHSIPVEKQEEKHQEILSRRNRKDKKEKKNEKYAQLVMANTGWTHEEAVTAMNCAQELTGAEYKEYASYRFWELDEDLQKTYFTKGHANALRAKYNTNKRNIRCFMNKDEFNECFHQYLGRPWLRNRKASLTQFRTTFQNENKIIYKPLSASCGAGVTVFELSEDNLESVYTTLSSLPDGVVEGYIAQHPEMAKYSQNSVNTVRLVTAYDGKEVHLLYGAMRMGGKNNVVDNLHNGGVVVSLDLENGELITNAIDLKGKQYAKHPITKEPIVGFKIPYWAEIVRLIKEAGKVIEGVGYVGWDIAVTEKGPLLIEGNTAPTPMIYQLPMSKQGKGVLHTIKKHL